MPESNLLIVAVDGLRASALGAYGNTSFPTPAFDEFAAESFLLDHCFAPSAELQAIYRALWHSYHPLRPRDFAASDKPLPQLFADRGYETTLVTDDPQVAALSASVGFAHCVQIRDISTERADDASQTAIAQLFAAASEGIAVSNRRQLMWVHSRGMYGPWDAPLRLQDALRDEGDPPRVEAIDPPDLNIASDGDPDIVFRFACAYAAQVMVLDACWDSFLATLAAAGAADDWFITLIGVRGFPLGEHNRIGGIDERLYVEQLHSPWLVRFPNARGRLARTNALTSHLDLLPTLVDSMGGSDAARTVHRDGTSLLPLTEKLMAPWREAIFSTSSTGTRGIRTAGWSFHSDANLASEVGPSTSNGASSGELFVRPDDRWEANDVAALCSEVAAGLSQVIDELSGSIRAGETTVSDKLPDCLRAYAT